MAQGRFRAKDFYVDPDIRKAESLPSTAFTRKEFLDLEIEKFFAKTWLFVPQKASEELRDDARALVQLVNRRGARVPVSVLEKPLFLQRDWKGQLHCFPNVCTHAWHTLVHGPERKKNIVCPQHGRHFDCKGRFVSQEGFKGLGDFPRACDNLKDLSLEQWKQFFFVNLDSPAAPLEDFLNEMKKSVVGLPIEEFKRHPQTAEVREVEGNWKQHALNYMDKFHIILIHCAPGGLADAIELPQYQTELYRYCALQWVYSRNPDHGFDPEFLPERFRDPEHPEKRVFALWWFIFPNTVLNFYPWGLSINVYMPIPDKPDKTLFLWYHYVMDEEKYKYKDEIWLNSQVDVEDIDAMVQVKRGVRSGFAPRGRFASKEESGPHWFQRLVYTMVFE